MPLLCNPNFVAINTQGSPNLHKAGVSQSKSSHVFVKDGGKLNPELCCRCCKMMKSQKKAEQTVSFFFFFFLFFLLPLTGWQPEKEYTVLRNCLSTRASLFARVHLCGFLLSVSALLVPGHPKPSDFTDNKAERRVIDTRAANCC